MACTISNMLQPVASLCNPKFMLENPRKGCLSNWNVDIYQQQYVNVQADTLDLVLLLDSCNPLSIPLYIPTVERMV